MGGGSDHFGGEGTGEGAAVADPAAEFQAQDGNDWDEEPGDNDETNDADNGADVDDDGFDEDEEAGLDCGCDSCCGCCKCCILCLISPLWCPCWLACAACKFIPNPKHLIPTVLKMHKASRKMAKVVFRRA